MCRSRSRASWPRSTWQEASGRKRDNALLEDAFEVRALFENAKALNGASYVGFAATDKFCRKIGNEPMQSSFGWGEPALRVLDLDFKQLIHERGHRAALQANLSSLAGGKGMLRIEE